MSEEVPGKCRYTDVLEKLSRSDCPDKCWNAAALNQAGAEPKKDSAPHSNTVTVSDHSQVTRSAGRI
jgi:hypothetical protein